MDKRSYLKKEICGFVELCDKRGYLKEDSIGWSKKPLHRSNLLKDSFRSKKWDYWSVFNDEYYVTVAITDMGYIRTAFLYILDKSSNRLYETSVNAINKASCVLSDTVYGDCCFTGKNVNIKVKRFENSIIINAGCNQFMFRDSRKELSLEFTIDVSEDQQSLNVVIPWDKSRFHFTSKQNCLPAEGWIRAGEETIKFEKKDTLASLDYGRGKWPYKSFWNWASCSSFHNGDRIGFNIGGGWTDGTGSNENAFYINNKLYKLDVDAEFRYDKQNKLKAWTIASVDSDSFYAEFEPVYHRLAKNNYVIIKSELHQIFGSFSGYFTADGKNKYAFTNLFGCVEEHDARW
ncbi:MAG: DUF2804 domain-containing protein [Bacillota bacterium]